MHKHLPITLLCTYVLLSVLLAAFQGIPLTYGSAEKYIAQATIQLARSNGFAKNALLLQTEKENTQALSDLQVALPLFVGEQTYLLQSRSSDLQNANGPYLALTTATQLFIEQRDPLQIAIILTNSRSYNVAMNSFLVLLQQHADDFNLRLVGIQEVVLVLSIFVFIAVQRRTRHA